MRSNLWSLPFELTHSGPATVPGLWAASRGNALVICNHSPPTPGAGRGIAVEMSGVFTFALSPQCGGNTRDLCYIGKKGGAMKT